MQSVSNFNLYEYRTINIEIGSSKYPTNIDIVALCHITLPYENNKKNSSALLERDKDPLMHPLSS